MVPMPSIPESPGNSAGKAANILDNRSGMTLDFPDNTPVPQAAPPPPPPPPPQPQASTQRPADPVKAWQQAQTLLADAWKLGDTLKDLYEKASKMADDIPPPEELKDRITGKAQDIFKEFLSDKLKDGFKEGMDCSQAKDRNNVDPDLKKFCDGVADDAVDIGTNIKTGLSGVKERIKKIADLPGQARELMDSLADRVKNFKVDP
jgi:hypothetical protein